MATKPFIPAPSKRLKDALAAERASMRQTLREGIHLGETEEREQIKSDLLKLVADAIDEKLGRMREGEGLGIIFRLEILREDWTFEDEPGDRASPAGVHWRATVLERDRQTCVECGAKENLHAHHVLPWAEHPEVRFEVGNGVTLCQDCHERQHPDVPALKYRR